MKRWGLRPRDPCLYQINEVVEHAGEYINSRHIELLCDLIYEVGKKLCQSIGKGLIVVI